ncbi:MAG: hypothetical protein AB7V27_17350 [Candidatus Binatia bacterium]
MSTAKAQVLGLEYTVGRMGAQISCSCATAMRSPRARLLGIA